MREQIAAVQNDGGQWLSKDWKSTADPWVDDWRKAALFVASDDGEFRSLARAIEQHGGHVKNLLITDDWKD